MIGMIPQHSLGAALLGSSIYAQRGDAYASLSEAVARTKAEALAQAQTNVRNPDRPPPPNFEALCADYEAAHETFMAGVKANRAVLQERADQYYQQFIDADQALHKEIRSTRWPDVLVGAVGGVGVMIVVIVVMLLIGELTSPAKASSDGLRQFCGEPRHDGSWCSYHAKIIRPKSYQKEGKAA